MQLHYYEDVYELGFNIEALGAEERARVGYHHFYDGFPVAGAIVLHYISLGIFSFIYYGMKHDDLPKLRRDDPNALLAVLLMFVPLFNLYWQFMLWVRLVRRLEFQYRLKGQPCPVNKDLAVTCMVCNLIPGVGLISFLVLMPMLISGIQNAVDGLAEVNTYNSGYSN